MINVKDAKETRKKVEEIKARRNNKTISKKTTTKKRVKKETKKEREMKAKFRKFLGRLILVEYIIFAAVLLICNQLALITENDNKTLIIKSQQQTIEKLLQNHENGQELKNNTSPITYIDNKLEAVKTESRSYLGTFKITHYCACTKCCGKNAQGITASGKKVEEGKTIAVDPKVIALGSEVYIDGYGYMEAQDTGSAIKGNIIDVYVADHQEALNLGVVYKDVYLVK